MFFLPSLFYKKVLVISARLIDVLKCFVVKNVFFEYFPNIVRKILCFTVLVLKCTYLHICVYIVLI